MSKVLVVGDGQSYYRPFHKFGEMTSECDILWDAPHRVNLVVFTGGADVSPSLYGQEAARGTGFVPRRDIYESISFHKARSLGLPMTGICRGAQFLNVMAGGSLIQHLDGHSRYHRMTTIDGEEFEVSSTHHQMIVPPPDGLLVGWSSRKLSRSYIGSEDKPINPQPEHETEVVYWPKIRAVGMQYHPEMMREHERGFKYAAELVEKYLL